MLFFLSHCTLNFGIRLEFELSIGILLIWFGFGFRNSFSFGDVVKTRINEVAAVRKDIKPRVQQ